MAPLRREKRGADSDGNIIYYNYKPAESMSEKLERKESMESTIEMTSQESPNQLNIRNDVAQLEKLLAEKLAKLDEEDLESAEKLAKLDEEDLNSAEKLAKLLAENQKFAVLWIEARSDDFYSTYKSESNDHAIFMDEIRRKFEDDEDGRYIDFMNSTLYKIGGDTKGMTYNIIIQKRVDKNEEQQSNNTENTKTSWKETFEMYAKDKENDRSRRNRICFFIFFFVSFLISGIINEGIEELVMWFDDINDSPAHNMLRNGTSRSGSASTNLPNAASTTAFARTTTHVPVPLHTTNVSPTTTVLTAVSKTVTHFRSVLSTTRSTHTAIAGTTTNGQ